MEQRLLSNGKQKKRTKTKLVNKNNKPKDEPTQPLSKRQELNNHIVCMRNGVKQAKIQIIGRLVHQIKKYRNRKGGEKEQAKAQRRCDRLLEEIQILKKIKKDKVSLYALLDTRKLDEVLNNPQASPEERVLARLSHHNVIINHVQKYRSENPNWDKQIPVLLEMTREKRGKKKDKTDAAPSPATAKKSREDNSKLDLVKSEHNNNKVDNFENQSVNEEQDSISDSDSEEHIGEEENDDEPIAFKPKLLNQKNKIVSKPGKKSDANSNSVSDKLDATSASLLNKSEGTVKVKFLTDLKDLEDDVADVGGGKEGVNITALKPTKRPKSAFFVGGVDEPESESESRPESKSFQKSVPFNKHNQNGHSKPVYKKGKLVSKPHPQNRKERRQFGRGGSDSRFGGKSEPIGAKKAKFTSEYHHQGENLLRPPHQAEAAALEKLHPSWEAKKKQQQISLTEFKGKKIVFNDDD